MLDGQAPSPPMTTKVFRFAPSPNGELHLGHALSAMLNHDLARAAGGRFRLRIEDVDAGRARRAFVAGIFADLAWLGLAHETPVVFQSARSDAYRAALDRLAAMGLTYPAFASRAETAAAIAAREAATGRPHPRDPDGAPLDPGLDRARDPAEAAARIAAGEPHAIRLRMDAAIARAGPLAWTEAGAGPAGETGTIVADPAAWGDVVLARKDAPASYHLAVVVDDAAEGVTDVVRGQDLFPATAVHRLLQTLLGLPAPRYRHHGLVRGPDGRKLSKSLRSESLAALRAAGETPAGIRRRLGLA